MSCELPVVVLDRGSLPELVIDRVCGCLCDPSDREGFARKALLLLSDSILRQKVGVAHRQRVDRLFRWEQRAASTTRVYDEMLRG